MFSKISFLSLAFFARVLFSLHSATDITVSQTVASFESNRNVSIIQKNLKS